MPRTPLTCLCLSPFHIIIILFASSNYHSFSRSATAKNNEPSLVEIGVVLDRDSPMGIMADLCINMAVTDFYCENRNYRTRLNLTIKDAQSLLDANTAVLDLLKHDKVHGILGQQNPLEDKFVAELGEKVHVPVISFTFRGSTLLYSQNRYFVRTTPDDAYQAQALAAICRGYEWDQEFDMVVGDTTLWAPRASYVDFSLPYSESGVTQVVKNKKPFDMWIFIKPLRWDLWLAIFLACIVMGTVLQILEHKVQNTNEESIGRHRGNLRMLYLSPIAVLAFPERNMVANGWSIFVLVFWLFMAFILMQSYTANLSAILTIDQLKFSFSEDYYVGYQDGSFTKDFLTQQLNICEARLRSYASTEEYHNAMSRGSKNGGIDAIFDEIPYMKILLKKYDSQYKMVGPTYRTDGFGFAFPIDSALTRHFSRAILNVTQGSNMTSIEQKNFGPGYSSQDPLSSTVSQETSSLTFYDFGGLFIIIGSVTMFALLCSETSIGRKFTTLTAHYGQICFSFIFTKFQPMQHDRDLPDREFIQDTGATATCREVLSGGEEENFESDENNNESTSVEDQEVELATINEGG